MNKKWALTDNELIQNPYTSTGLFPKQLCFHEEDIQILPILFFEDYNMITENSN